MKTMILAAALLLSSVVAGNATVLTFEGLGNGESIGNYYNGGAGGNLGITFSTNALAITSGNFGNNPSLPTILYFLEGSAATMNIASGFDTGFSFFYASNSANTGSVRVYDGLNQTGNLLAQFSLSDTPNPYYEWLPVGVTFSGIAKSVDFGGVANYIGFDDITLGSAIAGENTPVPEPGTMLLSGIGLGGLAIYAKRRKNRTA